MEPPQLLLLLRPASETKKFTPSRAVFAAQPPLFARTHVVSATNAVPASVKRPRVCHHVVVPPARPAARDDPHRRAQAHLGRGVRPPLRRP